jgi:hypothetical protein
MTITGDIVTSIYVTRSSVTSFQAWLAASERVRTPSLRKPDRAGKKLLRKHARLHVTLVVRSRTHLVASASLVLRRPAKRHRG